MTGREYLGEIRARFKRGPMHTDDSRIRLFISHSSRDSELVELLVALLRAALGLPASQIRCTSIDGYRLPGGVNTDEQLKRELHAADAFVGIISSESLRSLYVAFELGARWGAGRPLLPVLAPGTDPAILEGPLTGLNALNAGNRAQLHQLVTDLSDILNVRPEAPAAYERNIEAILNLKGQTPATFGNKRNGSDSEELSEKETKILQLVAEQGDYQLQLSHIADGIGENLTRTRYYVDRLLDREFLHDALSAMVPTTYGLKLKGRAYLVERGLV